jgi:hypothetical protein
MSSQRVVGAALAGTLIGACGGDTSPTVPPHPTPFTVSVAGRLERDGVVRLTARVADTAIIAGNVTYAVTPPGAVSFVSDGTATLLSVGRATVVARAGTLSDTIVLDVVAPPTIVYDQVVNGRHVIYRAALDGLDTVRISSGARDDVSPTVARDTVVFVSFRDGNAELYSVPIAGGVERRLTNTPFDESSPSMARAVPRLAFTQNPSGIDQVWLAASDASGAAPALTAPSSVESVPRLSPAGDRLIFVSTVGTTASIAILPLTSSGSPIGAAATLPLGPGPNVDPAWSADGSSVAFISARPGAPGLYKYELASGIVSLILAGTDVGQPSYLADGRIVFTRFSGPSRLQWVDPAVAGGAAVAHEIPLGNAAVAHAVAR